MIDIIFTITKYLIILCMGVFTFISFRVQRDVPDERKLTSYSIQRSMIIAIHAISFFVMCLHQLNGNFDVEIWYLIAFYLAQLAYLLIMTIVVPKLIHLNNGLNNVMCMFLSVGFIIQTRLSFSKSIRQFIIILVGTLIFLFFCLFCKKAGFLRNLTWLYCVMGMGLLLLVFVLATVSRGAKLSIDIGLFSFQPLEFVKIIFVFFVASAFYKSTSFKNVVITAILAAAHVLIQVACTDLGSAFILFSIYLFMLYVATKKSVYLLLGSGAFAAAAFAAYKLFSHVKVRVSAWLDPWSDIEASGWQIAHSLFAIGTGGWFGSGLLQGSPESIPIVEKDMVISAISEEFGAIFAIIFIMLCLCYTLMIFRIAMRIELLFYKLLAFGLGVSYIVQVFLTIGGAFKFIPLTGVTLPFVSNGGSSILSSLIIIGIIQALFVISEADVAHERRMVAAGADIYEFSGYEDLRPEDEYEALDEYLDDECERDRDNIGNCNPDSDYENINRTQINYVDKPEDESYLDNDSIYEYSEYTESEDSIMTEQISRKVNMIRKKSDTLFYDIPKSRTLYDEHKENRIISHINMDDIGEEDDNE